MTRPRLTHRALFSAPQQRRPPSLNLTKQQHPPPRPRIWVQHSWEPGHRGGRSSRQRRSSWPAFYLQGVSFSPGHHQIYLLIGPHCEAQGPFWSKTLSSSRVAGKGEAPLSFKTPMCRSQQAARMGSRGGASPAPATSSLGQKAEPRPCLGGQGRLRAFDTLPHLCLTCLCLHGTYMTSGIAFLFGVVTSNFIEMHIF